MADAGEKQALLSSRESSENKLEISSSSHNHGSSHEVEIHVPVQPHMCAPGLHWFPLAVFICVPITFIISYCVAVFLGHVEPGFPYISDTGAISPESCIFSQLLNMCSVVVGITMYIRYKQSLLFELEICDRKLNVASFIIGLIAAFGVSLVANFQETNVLVVHFTGAIMAFGLGTVYCCIQTIISFHTSPTMNSVTMCYVRLSLSLITAIMFICTFTTDGLAKHQFHGQNPRKWFPDDGGFTLHLISTISEWTMAICFLMFFLTFISEFKKLKVKGPEISHHSQHHD